MSMYKSIFVIGENDENGVAYTDGQEVMLGGKAVVFGETAFASVDKAVGSLAADTSAIVAVVKVETGKYESFTVVNVTSEGAARTEYANVSAVDFSGKTDGIAVSNAGFLPDVQEKIVAELNTAASDTFYVAAKDVDADFPVTYVGSVKGADPIVAVSGAAGSESAVKVTTPEANSFYKNADGKWVIADLAGLEAFRDSVNAGNTYKNQTVLLDADIDLASVENWESIGSNANKFLGNFDGQNHTISNLNCVHEGVNYVGFFGYASDGSLKNFTIDNAVVKGRLGVGAVAGCPYTANVDNVKLTGLVKIDGMAYVGGMLGHNAYGNLTNLTVDVQDGSYVHGNSIENGIAYRSYVGGVVGFIGEGNRLITNVSSNINVSGTTCDVGGISGIAHYGNNFENVTCDASSVKITQTGAEADGREIGGIAGVWMDDNRGEVSVKNCEVSENLNLSTTVVDEQTGEVVKELTNADLEENMLYGSSYHGNGAGGLNVSSTGLKQYVKDAVIDSNLSETYGNVVVGASGLASSGDEKVADDGNMTAKVTVKGDLITTGYAEDGNSDEYFWIGGEYNNETEAKRFTLEVDGGSVEVGSNQGTNIRKDGTLNVINGGSFDTSVLTTKGGTILVDGEESSLSVRDSELSLRSGAEMTVSDGAKFTLKYGTEAASANLVELDATSTLTVEDGAVFESIDTVEGFSADQKLVNAGTINVNSATVDFDVVENTGEFNVSGNSTLKIGSLTGSVVAADDTVLTDSNIGGTLGYGKVTFKGDNSVGLMSLNYYYGAPEVVVGSDASLAVTSSSRVTFGYNAAWDIDGNIKDALTADKKELKASLSVAGGFSITGGSGAKLTADNAYLIFGLTTSKNSVAAGDFDLTFTNSIVDFTNNFSIAASSGSALNKAKSFDIVFDKSVVNASANLDNTNADSAMIFKNGSVATISSGMRNDGTFEVLSGSSVTANNVIQFGEHSGNTGKIIVDGTGSVLTLNNANMGSIFENRDTIIVSNGGTLDVDYLENAKVIAVNDGTLKFNTLTDIHKTGNGVGAQLYVTGTSTISGSKITGDNKLRIGQVDSNGDGVADGRTENNKITLDVDSMSLTFGNIYNADVKLAKDIAVTMTGVYGDGYFFVTNTDIDLNGKTWTHNGALMLDADIKNGTITFDGEKGEYGWSNIVFQHNASTIASDAKVDVVSGSAISVYEDLTVNGSLVDTRDAINWATISVGLDQLSNGQKYSDGAVLTVSGENAVFESANNSMKVYGANEELDIEASKLVIENDGKVSLGGTLINEGSVEVNGGTLIAETVVTGGGIKDGDIVREGGDILVSGESTVQIKNLNNGNVYLADGAVLKKSYINNTNDSTIGSTVLLGSAGFKGGFSAEWFCVDWTWSAGGTITIEDGTVLTATCGVAIAPAPGNEYVVNGGTILLENTAAADGTDKIYSFTVGYGSVTLNSDLVVNGAGDKDGSPIQFQYADVYVNSTITQLDNSNENSVVKVQNSNVWFNQDAVINSAVRVSTPWGEWNGHKNGVLHLSGATVNGNITVDAKSELNLTADGGVVNGLITAASLTFDAYDKLTVQALDVNDLTLAIGSSLTVTGTGSIVDSITITGELVPDDAKFVLVDGWENITGGSSMKVLYNGEEYEVKASASGLSGLQFFVEDNKLCIQDLGASRTGIYIGDLSDAVEGKIVINGAEYIVGETAFGTAKDAADAAAAGTVDFDTEDITSTTLGSGDHISDLEANGFTAVDTLIIGSKQEVVDTAEAIFDNDLTINNAGHLEANIGVDGDLFITNSAVDTLVGKYAAWYMNIDNNGGKIENAALEADEVVIDGGKGISVTVDASTLTLSNIDMELVGGMVLSDTFAQINMDENTKLTIAGDGLTVNSYIYGISSVDGSVAGSVVMAGGTQTYTGAVEADSIMINSDAKVTASDLLFSSLTVDGELTADFTGFASYSDGGVVDGSGTIKAAHNGMWIINDTVSRDFSGFTGTVALTGTGAGIAMGLGDMGTADSYFADGTTVVLGGGQSAMLSEDGKATGIVFEGQGDLNVGMMKRNSSKAIEVTDVNAGFKQTLTADNSSFEGTANVAEGATLTLKGNFGGHVNLDVNAAGTQATTLELAGNGIDVAGTITGDANDIVAVNDDAVLSGTGALNSFYGTVDVAAGKQLDLNAANTTAAILNGSTTAKVNVNADTVLNGTGALDGFYGQVAVADAADTLSLSGVNDTDALFTGAGNISTSANQTFGAAALNGFTGKVALGADLTLDGANTTSATVTGATTITADSAKQEFTGDVSGFTGTFVATGSDVKLSGTFANAINANGTGSLTLGDKTQAVQVNAGTGTLATLNFGNNTLTVGTGSFTDINGTGSVYFTKNDSFNSIAAKDVNLTSSNGWNITVNTLTADINLTIDAAQTDSTADVTVNGAFGKNINVSVTDTSAIPNGSFYKLVGADSFTITGITLTVGTDSGVLALGQSIKLGGFTYQLRENAGVWELGQRAGNSNIVVVNALWTADPYATVDDNGLDRSIGFDAAMNIDKAVSYIRGYAEGQGWSEGTNTGDAKIELAVNATYTIGDDVYLMTADNKVTQLTLEGRNGGTVASDILGTDGSINGTLTIVNLNTTRDIFAGGNLIIDNEASNTARGSYLAGGTETGAAAGDTSVTLKGGSYSFRHIAGGSILTTAAAAVVSDKNSKVVIANETTGNLVVSGNLTGGSVSCEGSLTVNGTSTLEINVGDGSKGVTQIRGNIYAAGIADDGDLTVNGDAKVIFTGDASDLRFTGRVYGGAFNGSTFNGKSDLEFKDFNGAFNGNILDFNTITISGSSTLEIARRQTGTAETAINFVVNAATGSDAMYTVRDANSWEFAKNITVDVDNAQNGTYVLVDNYAGGYSDFNVSVGGAACSVGQSVYVGNDKYTVVASGDQLKLTVAKGEGYTGGDLTGSVAVSDMIVTGKITGASVDISGTSAVQSGISSPNSTALTLNIADNSDATIEGGIVGKGSDTISVGDNAQVTITGGIQTTGGNDSIVIGTNSNVEITGEVKATNGDDSIVIGDGSTVEIKGTDRIYLGNGQNSTVVGKNASLIVGGLLEGSGTLEIGKGGTVQTKGCESIIFVTMDVDSVLNNTSAIQSGIKVDVVGVSDLVLNDAADADIAGVKAVYHGCSSIQDNAKLKVDGVDMVLGSAKQIQGADTTETTDDVWASLNRVGNDLVVAWGRSEAEVGVALTAFGDGTSLVLGESFTATATTLSDSNPDNDFQKKSQGTLA